MMTEFFGLKMNPFEKGSIPSEDAFQSEDRTAIFNLCQYAVDRNGIALITARPGLGKTYALSSFMKQLNGTRYTKAYISQTTGSVLDFYRGLCEKLSIDSDGFRSSLISRIRSRIHSLYADAQQPLVLVVDEAQELSRDILKEIRLLTNFRYDSLNCFTLILAGEKRLRETLRMASNESLRQRITGYYDCQGLSAEETYRYVLHKLRLAGGEPHIVNEDFSNVLHDLSGGVPRKVDNLMTNALQLASQTHVHELNAQILMTAQETIF